MRLNPPRYKCKEKTKSYKLCPKIVHFSMQFCPKKLARDAVAVASPADCIPSSYGTEKVASNF